MDLCPGDLWGCRSPIICARDSGILSVTGTLCVSLLGKRNDSPGEETTRGSEGNPPITRHPLSPLLRGAPESGTLGGAPCVGRSEPCRPEAAGTGPLSKSTNSQGEDVENFLPDLKVVGSLKCNPLKVTRVA